MGTGGALEGEQFTTNGVLCLFTIRFARLAVSITKITTIPLFFHHDFRVSGACFGSFGTGMDLILHWCNRREAWLSGVHSFTACRVV